MSSKENHRTHMENKSSTATFSVKLEIWNSKCPLHLKNGKSLNVLSSTISISVRDLVPLETFFWPSNWYTRARLIQLLITQVLDALLPKGLGGVTPGHSIGGASKVQSVKNWLIWNTATFQPCSPRGSSCGLHTQPKPRGAMRTRMSSDVSDRIKTIFHLNSTTELRRGETYWRSKRETNCQSVPYPNLGDCSQQLS